MLHSDTFLYKIWYFVKYSSFDNLILIIFYILAINNAEIPDALHAILARDTTVSLDYFIILLLLLLFYLHLGSYKYISNVRGLSFYINNIIKREEECLYIHINCQIDSAIINEKIILEIIKNYKLIT